MGEKGATLWNIALLDGEEVIERPVNQVTLTDRYTDRALSFIRANRDGPFFLYLAYAMPHVPLFVPDRFYDPDPRKAYAQVVAHIDECVGRILDALEAEGIDENTLVIFTSDNGPWAKYGHHAGSADPLRGAKFSCFEGGVRMPGIMRWPGRIKAGRVSDEVVGMIDMLPTLAELGGRTEALPSKIDGRSIAPILADPEARSPHPVYFYWSGDRLVGVRKGKWKVYQNCLYDLGADMGETTDLSEKHPDVYGELLDTMSRAETEMKADVIEKFGEWRTIGGKKRSGKK
jgi:arylsulfatase A-like enzyme